LIRLAALSPHDEKKLRASIIDLVPDFNVNDRKGDVLPLRTRRSGEQQSQ
jgi:hypothetical protein